MNCGVGELWAAGAWVFNLLFHTEEACQVVENEFARIQKESKEVKNTLEV